MMQKNPHNKKEFLNNTSKHQDIAEDQYTISLIWKVQ